MTHVDQQVNQEKEQLARVGGITVPKRAIRETG
jgi:hypothetical protein